MSDDLSRAMRATTENLNPNIGKLTAGGVERGVRKRRMRRISQIGGAAASVTAVFGVVAAVGLPGSGSDSGSASPAAGGTSTTAGPAGPAGLPPAALAGSSTTGSAPTAPKATPTAPSSTPAQSNVVAPTSAPSAPPVSGQDIVKLLKQQVAPLNFSDVTVLNQAGSTTAGGPYAVLKVSYGAGVGNVSVEFENQSWSNMHFGDTLPADTSIRTLSDGSHVLIYNGLEWPAGNGDPTAKRLDATWYRNDGVSVTIEGLNEATEKGATTATAVPLTVDQAVKIATAPVWDAAAAAKAYQGWLDYKQVMAANGKPVDGKALKPTGSSAH